ncbi:20705_t:CDS:2, partial [Dentiscutata erythropus]
NCLLEKKPVKEQKAQSNNDKSKNVSYADAKEAKQKQSESEKENALLKKIPKVQPTFKTLKQEDPMDITVNFPIANSLETDKARKTVAIRCNVKIKGTPVIAILDSGAAMSIITNKLIKRLGLAPTKESKTVVVTANSGRSKALGIVENIKIVPDEDKIDKIKNYPIPVTLRQIWGFLELVSYYRKFTNRFSKIAKPLNQLLKNEL